MANIRRIYSGDELGVRRYKYLVINDIDRHPTICAVDTIMSDHRHVHPLMFRSTSAHVHTGPFDSPRFSDFRG
jgi:hypothetical protein